MPGAAMREPRVFAPAWPEGLEKGKVYRLLCDDKGGKGGTWLCLQVAEDGDVHVTMQDWEDIPEGIPNPIPSLRSRTFFGGGRSLRAHQALLWLADGVRRDEEEREARARRRQPG